MVVRVKIEGLKQLEKNLEQFSRATSRAVVKRALRKAAKPIQETAKSYAPYQYGTLEKSIKITPTAPKGHEVGKAAFAKAMSEGRSRSEAVTALRDARRENPLVEMFVIAKDPVAHMIEFGTDERFNKNTGGSYGSVAPDPFMRPAFDLKASVSLSIIKKHLSEEIEKTAARIRAKAISSNGKR